MLAGHPQSELGEVLTVVAAVAGEQSVGLGQRVRADEEVGDEVLAPGHYLLAR